MALAAAVLLGGARPGASAPARAPAGASAAIPASPPMAPALRDAEIRFLDLLVVTDPVRATLLGIHDGDGELGPGGADARRVARERWEAFERELDALDDSLMTADDHYDVALMRYDIELRRFEEDTLGVDARDPGRALGTVAAGLHTLLVDDGAPLAERVGSLISREKEVPDYLSRSLAQVHDPPRVLVEQAVSQADALTAFLIDSVPGATRALADGALVDSLSEAGDRALEAVWSYREALLRDVLPHAGAGFALGPDLYAGYLRAAEGVTTPLPRLRARADDEIRRLDSRFRAVAARIDSTLTPAQVMMRVSEDHPPASEIGSAVRAALAEARAFCIRDGAVPILPGPRIQVRPTPALSDWTNASLAVPGPFERGVDRAVFYITLPDPSSPPEAREEVLRFLNYSLIRNLAVHEAYPGHYAQAQVLDRLDRPVRRAVMSRAFGEGWAHYAESLMLERGYRADDPTFRLATLQSALRRAGRFRVALGLQTEGWTVDQAAGYLEEHCYLEPAIARKEAERGTFDPFYLVYTLGRLQIESLRTEVKRAEGKDFDLARFHARLLELGEPPIPMARAMLLRRDMADGRWLD